MGVAEAIAVGDSPSRRERKKQELQNRILETAQELFEQKGVSATTVAEICLGADVATKTFFNHFSTKQQLVERLAHASLEIFLNDLASLRTETTDLQDWLLRFFAQVADTVTHAGPMHRELVNEIVHAISSDSGETQQALQLREAFLNVVRDGVARGEVSTLHDVETQSELIIGAFYSLMFSWTHLEDYPIRERARALALLLGDALRNPTTNKETLNGTT